ncbi:MAG: hypothetical protein DMG71_14005, partial [Acidobacteria bacterium]
MDETSKGTPAFAAETDSSGGNGNVRGAMSETEQLDTATLPLRERRKKPRISETPPLPPPPPKL